MATPLSSAPLLLDSNASPTRRASVSFGGADIAAPLKRKLLVAALETPVRLRSDIDLVMVQQYLASLGVFTTIPPQILHCTLMTSHLATECTIRRIPDGEVLYYQGDPVNDGSCAYIILEGSLCGYFNKAFSQRSNPTENFRAWNGKQTRKRGVAVDFGDLQATHCNGNICGVDDFCLGVSSGASSSSHQHAKLLTRRRSVHSQDITLVLQLSKDTMDRASHRFGLVYERGVFMTTKALSRSDLHHLAIFSHLSESAKVSLLENSPKRELERGDVLYGGDKEESASSDNLALLVVLYGRVDIYCIANTDPEQNLSTGVSGTEPKVSSETNGESSSTISAIEETPAHAQDPTSIPRSPLVSLMRGQTFGDQMVSLGHSHIWKTTPHRHQQSRFCFRVVAGDDTTEILWITRDRYEDQVREDRLRFSYHPVLGHHSPVETLEAVIGTRDVYRITRWLLADAILSKFFFQFPPLVFERLCHGMESCTYEADTVLLEAGEAIDSVLVVVTGALHSRCSASNSSRELDLQGNSTEKRGLRRQSTEKPIELSHDVDFLPGDTFGARELFKRRSATNEAVYVDTGTTVLCIPRGIFERWVVPMRHNTIIRAGSIMQTLASATSSFGASGKAMQYSKYVSRDKITRRQSGPSAFSPVPDTGTIKNTASARSSEEAAVLLKRFGLFPTLPRFLLAQMLPNATIITKKAGEELFREGDAQQALVVVLSGFVSFYSLEHMDATVDMFQKHPFCHFVTFCGSTVSPEDYIAEPHTDENATCIPHVTPMKHRAAMHGVHIQTLPSHNAFRTGVLQEGSVCPATVLAQTDCDYLVFDEAMYAQTLIEHAPTVDMSSYVAPSSSETSLPSSSTTSSPLVDLVSSPPQSSSGPVPAIRDIQPGAIPPSLLAYLDENRISWLPCSSAKRKLLLRAMRYVTLAPGQRLIQCNETIEQVVLVISGKLSVYIRENKEVSSVLDASQRSVQSVMLERSVTSNYSTTSQQLNQHRSSTFSSGTGGQSARAKRNALRRKIARISEQEMTEDQPKASPSAPAGRFTSFVLAAARENKARKSSIEDPQDAPRTSEQPESTLRPHPPRRSLHSMVAKVTFQRKFDSARATEEDSTGSKADKRPAASLFLFHLGPGDIYGDEITAPSGTFLSVHDIFADTSGVNSSSDGKTALRRVAASQPTEILCLDRHALLAILAKAEEDAADELELRSATAKAKWQLASKKLFRQGSHSSMEGEQGRLRATKKMPKLFDLFKNILNQRRFLTMGTITDIPQLRYLPEDARRELCLNARFEALDRYTNAYKDSGDANQPGTRFFLLLSGRIMLLAKGPSSGFLMQNTAAVGATTTSSSALADNFLREVKAGEGFGEFEILVPDASTHVAATAAEPTKLLSIPANMFLKHWPLSDAMRGHIDYLRDQVPYFAALELERVAYLYHSFVFQTHARGTKIFQRDETQRAGSPVREVYLIKDGTCCIRQRVTLRHRQAAGTSYFACDSVATDASITRRDSNAPPSTQRRANKSRGSANVVVTVADVSAGHAFWIDGNDFPFMLEAISASVTVASISIDKLRAIVPRTSLTGLEEICAKLAELYAQQFELAKRAIVTSMNEKRSAQLGGSAVSSTTLPVLLLPPPRAQPSPPNTPGTRPRGGAAAPLSRSLQCKPNDFIPHQEDRESSRVEQQRLTRTAEANAAYDDQHLVEHYDVGSDAPASSLMGSFPGRTPAGYRLSTISTPGNSRNVSVDCSASKLDENSAPETTVAQEGPRKQLHLHVTLPMAGRLEEPSSNPVEGDENYPTVPAAGARWRGARFTRRSSPGSQSLTGAGGATLELVQSADGTSYYEVDVRARVRAQMCTIGSPFRTMRLEATHTKENGLGKYGVDIMSPFASSEGGYRQQYVTQRQLESPPCLGSSLRARSNRKMPLRTFKRSVNALRSPNCPGLQTQPELTRKQGFLTTLRVSNAAARFDSDERIFLESVLPRVHQGRRFFYALVDSELREYADTVAINALSQTSWLHSYDLHGPRGPATVSDMPVAPGEAESLLLQSFLLVVDDSNQFMLTASSAMEKHKWMAELSQASVLGPPHHRTTQLVATKLQSPRPSSRRPSTSSSTTTAAPATPTVRQESKSRGRRRLSLVSGPLEDINEPLLVEYRIR